MLRIPALLCAALLGLSACSAPEVRFDAPASTEAPARVAVPYGRIEVLAASLPAYALSEEINSRDATGAIAPLGPLWADEPSRGVTLELVRELGAITGRLVAPDPWPFRDPSDVRIDLRFDTFLATQDGVFRVAGQVFVAPEEAAGRDRALRFDISAPIADTSSAAAIAAARAEAIRQLATLIARQGLR